MYDKKQALIIAVFSAIIILIALLPWKAAADWNLIDLQELSVDYKDYAAINDHAKDPLIFPEHPKEGINLNINTDFLTHFFWDSTIESVTTEHQYRGVGLQMQLGVSLFESVDVGLYHHSQHVLDRGGAYMPFPEADAIQVKFYLFRAKPGRPGVF